MRDRVRDELCDDDREVVQKRRRHLVGEGRPDLLARLRGRVRLGLEIEAQLVIHPTKS
jgi:hypothetical protein